MMLAVMRLRCAYKLFIKACSEVPREKCGIPCGGFGEASAHLSRAQIKRNVFSAPDPVHLGREGLGIIASFMRDASNTLGAQRHVQIHVSILEHFGRSPGGRRPLGSWLTCESACVSDASRMHLARIAQHASLQVPSRLAVRPAREVGSACLAACPSIRPVVSTRLALPLSRLPGPWLRFGLPCRLPGHSSYEP